MRELLTDLRAALATGEPLALATAVAVDGSAPRPAGTLMAVTADGAVIGSLSGGCVEAAVYDASLEVLAGAPPSRHSYGVSDPDGMGIGLTCGGRLDVVVRRVAGDDLLALQALVDAVAAGSPVACATVTGGAAPLGALLVAGEGWRAGSLGSAGLDAAVARSAADLLPLGGGQERLFGADGDCAGTDVTVFVHAVQPPPRLLIFGATDYSGALARVGKLLGYSVTICDARPVFATPERFPAADEVVCAWPHEFLARTPVDGRTAICVLTHDPKFDLPLLVAALRSPAGYVGAMGSRRTHADRIHRLLDSGLAPDELARLRSPIGLDLGGGSVEATAVSIAAEIVRDTFGGTGRPLSEVAGPIHRPQAVPVG